MNTGDREPSRPPTTAQRPAVDDWLVEICDRDTAHPYRHTYRLSAAEPELYDSILYACGEDYQEHTVSMILYDDEVWVAVIPAPGNAADVVDGCYDGGWVELPPTYVLRHLEQAHAHVPAGTDPARQRPLNLTISVRRLSPPIHGAE